MFDILIWIALGAVAGSLAKALMPGADPGGLLKTILLGVGGAFAGGLIGRITPLPFLRESADASLSLGSIFTATVGAVVLLALWRLMSGKKE